MEYLKREEIFEYVKNQYGTVPEYLWETSPKSAVLRHKNGKWYAVLMQVETVPYTHIRAHETPEHLVCRLLLEKKKWRSLNHISEPK